MLSGNTNTLITGGTFVVTSVQANRELQILHSHISSESFHDSGERLDPPRCHPETRRVLLGDIMTWVSRRDEATSVILWLNGPAGSGKSALSQSISELCHDEGLLAASFFFSGKGRDSSHYKHLITTIAYQVALSYPECRSLIEAAIHEDPSVFDRSLQAQFRKLVIEPLCKVMNEADKTKPSLEQQTRSKVIVIDALDECRDPKVQRYILSMIGEEYHRQTFPLLFIITSRPERHIGMSFAATNLASISSSISLSEYYDSYEDVRAFLVSKFDEIKREHPLAAYIPDSWPSEETWRILLTKSSGQFIYAATVIEYISSIHHRPTDRLDAILGLVKYDDDPPFSELDLLYNHVLSSVVDVQQALRILGTILLMDLKLSPEMVESFLFLRPGDVQLYLGGLASIINFYDDRGDIKVMHGSLSDFLFDEKRAGQFYVKPGIAHANIAVSCLHHLENFKIPLLVDYACYNFETHFDLADPTESLHDILFHFSFVKLCRNFQHVSSTQTYSLMSFSLEDLWYFIPTFFDCIQNSVMFKDSNEISECHSRLLDEYLSLELNKYDVDNKLGDLVTLVVICFSPVVLGDLDDAPYFKDTLLQLSDAEHLLMIDESSLNLRYMVRRHSQSEPFIELLCEFLQDKDRSGSHFIDGNKFARAALRCMQLIQNITLVPQKRTKDQRDYSLLTWALECVSPLLLHASHDETLLSLLKDITLQLRGPSSATSLFLMSLVQEARLSYMISETFKLKELDPSCSSHSDLTVVPQGFKIIFPENTPENGSIPVFSHGCWVDDTVSICGEFCCIYAFIVGYIRWQRQDMKALTTLIFPVEDPFPEINAESPPRPGYGNGTPLMAGVMNIVIYRFWKDLVQGGMV